MIASALRRTVEFAASSLAGHHPHSPKLARWFFGAGMRSDAGIDVTEEKALSLGAFWKGINMLTNDVAKIPLHTYRRVEKFGRSGKERDKDHPACQLLRHKSNSETPALHFKKTLTWHAIAWGNGYAHIVRDGGARPLELVQLDPVLTQPRRIDGQLVYQTMVGGMRRTFYPEDVLHIKGLSYDGLKGYPVLEVHADLLGMPLAARKFGARFYANGAVASGILMQPEGLSEEGAKRLKKSFEQAHGDLGNKHRVIMLEDGAKFQQLTIPQEHAQFLETREFENREIANLLGIPPHKLGDPGPTSYNSLENLNQDYLDQGLDYWLCAWEEECWDKLLTEQQKREDSHFFQFVRKAVLTMDATTRTGLYSAGFDRGIYSANDWLEMEDEEPVASGNVRYVPANMVPVTDENGQPLAVEQPQPEPPQLDEQDENEDEDEDETEELDQAHRDLITNDIGRVVRRIATQCRKQSKKGSKAFLRWYDDEMAATQLETCTAMLAPSFAACPVGSVIAPAEAVGLILDDFSRALDQVVHAAKDDEELVELVEEMATAAEGSVSGFVAQVSIGAANNRASA